MTGEGSEFDLRLLTVCGDTSERVAETLIIKSEASGPFPFSFRSGPRLFEVAVDVDVC